MPATSPEAIARKQAKQNAKRKQARQHSRIEIKKSDLPRYKIAARKMRGKLPPMSKSELREMLAQAFRNTAETADA